MISKLKVIVAASLPLFLNASIDSGGRQTTVGSYQNHSSIGSMTATGAHTVDHLVHRNGALEILYTLPRTDEVDSDNDTLPDNWEAQNGLAVGINDANADRDGDGASNLMEYIAGTDPQSSSSAPNSSLSNHAGTWHISMDTVSAREYRLYVSVDLEHWTEWDTFAGDGSTVTFSFDPESAAAQTLLESDTPSAATFFRIELSVAP